METSREDVGIAIRSALLKRGTQQKFSLLVLIFLSCVLIFSHKIKLTPLNYLRSFVKDTIYHSAVIVSYPFKSFNLFFDYTEKHFNLYSNYELLKNENKELKNQISKSDFLELENTQLRKLIDEQEESASNFLSARVMLEKDSPYINSFIINIGSNKKIKNGMAVLEGKNFIGRIVDVNFFSSRVLLISDLNSKIPVLIEPAGYHAILSGHGDKKPTLEYLPEKHKIQNGDKIYTSGKEGIFTPGIPVGSAEVKKNNIEVQLFSNLNQITFVNIDLEKAK